MIGTFGLPEVLLLFALPLGAMAFLAFLVWLGVRTVTRQRSAADRAGMAAAERGVPVPPEVFLTDGHRRPRNTLRTGMVELALGFGLVAALLICCPESRLWGWGLVVILVGMANLVYWGLRGRQEWDEARARDMELARRWAASADEAEKPEAGDS
ncbi:MAG: hypothetical protein GXP47_01630 [Acidobacteria bacterium]|nr:hypothetical protein [Acidobacteriota bacterium]